MRNVFFLFAGDLKSTGTFFFRSSVVKVLPPIGLVQQSWEAPNLFFQHRFLLPSPTCNPRIWRIQTAAVAAAGRAPM